MDPLVNFDTQTKVQLVFYHMYRLCVNNLTEAEDGVCKEFLTALYNKTIVFDALDIHSRNTADEEKLINISIDDAATINLPPQASLTTDFQEIYTDRAVLISDSLIEEEDFSDTEQSSDEE